MAEPESHKVTIKGVRAEALETKKKVDAELAAIRKRLGVTLPDNQILPLDADGNPDLAKVYEQISLAITEIRDLENADSRKTPAQVKQALDEFVRAQDQFVVAIKIAQSLYFSKVVSHCDEIIQHLETKDDLAAIPQLSDQLRAAVQRINDIPPIAQLESRSDELARMASLHSVAAKLIEPTESAETPLASADAKSSEDFRRNAALLSRAMQENVRPFQVFISNQSKPRDQQQPIPQTTQKYGEARDAVISNTIELGKAQAARYASLSAAKTKELQDQQQKLRDELAKAQAKFAEEAKPKSIFRRFVNFITRVKPNDTSALQAQIKTLQQNLAQVDQQIKNIEFQAREAEGFVKDVTQYRDTTIAQRQETNVRNFTQGTERFANDLSLNEGVRSVAQRQAREESAQETKQQILARDLTTRFQEAFVIAKAINEGTVTRGGDGIDAALGVGKVAAEYIPVVGQAISVIATIAGKVNDIRHAENNRNIADFGTEHEEDIHSTDAGLRDLIVARFAEQLSQIYGHVSSDGSSPLDPLTRQGINVFSTTVISQAISTISSFKLPADVKIPTLDANRFRTDLSYRTQISEKYGIAIDEKQIMQPQYARFIDNQICASFVSQSLVSATIAGAEAGVVSKLSEFASKVRLKDDVDIEPKYAGQKFTVNGMMQRVGIVTQEGDRYISTQRKEGVEGIGSKYGFRLATAREESAIAKGEIPRGYAAFTSALEKFEEQKQPVLQALQPQDFKNTADYQNRDEVLSSFVQKCCEAKAENSKLDIHQFIKDNSPFKVGKTTGIGGRGADKDRERFREIEKQIMPLIEAYGKVQISEEKQAKRQETRGTAANDVNQQALQSLTEEGAKPSQAAPSNVDRNTEIFAKAEARRPSAKEVKRLTPYVDNSSSHQSSADRHQIEAITGLDSKFEAFLSAVVGIDKNKLPRFLQSAIDSVSSTLSDDNSARVQNVATDFVAYGERLAQSFSQQSKAFGAQPDGEERAMDALQHSLNISSSSQKLGDSVRDYEARKAELIRIITPGDLVGKKGFTSEKGAEGILLGFAEAYHAKIIEGASADEMRKFSMKAILSFMHTENTALVAKVVEFAASYSESRFAEAAVKISIAQALGEATQAEAIAKMATTEAPKQEVQVHNVASNPLVKAANEALEQMKSQGINLADLGIKNEGNKIIIPHANSTAEKPMHLVVETDEAGKVKDAHLHVHDNHLQQRAEQSNSSIKAIIAEHGTHHNIAKEIIEQHNSRAQQHLESRGGGNSR